MRTCKCCGEKVTFKSNINSILNRKGKIVCERCKSVFIFKNSLFSWVLDAIIILLGIEISDIIGGIKGIGVAIIVMVCIMIIKLYFNNFYKIKNN